MGKVKAMTMENNDREQDLLIADLDHENRLLKAKNEHLEKQLSEKRKLNLLTETEIDKYIDDDWVGYSGYENCFKEVIAWAQKKLVDKNQ